MSLSSLNFILFFLPISVLIYKIIKKINSFVTDLVLMAINWSFIFFVDSHFFLLVLTLLILTILFSFIISKTSEKISRALVLAYVLSICLVVLFFKYANILFKTDIIIPIGLSFVSFRSISYILDIYKKKITFNKNIIKTIVYLSFFAHFISGPIERYDVFCDTKDSLDKELLFDGAWRYVIGLCKKVLVADSLSRLSGLLNVVSIDKSPASFLWVMSICYSLQLYFDFSGYSDMAIGITNMFGYNCEDNFNYPYISKSISEFWRRWHISLGKWFKDYVYIPLGGSRKGKKALCINLLIVWLLTGIWHGASINFIIWGLSYFVLVMFEKLFIHPDKLKRIPSVLYRGVSLAVINVLWVVFKYSDLQYLKSYLLRMFGISKINDVGINVWHSVWDFKVFIIAAILFSIPVYPKLMKLIESKSKKVQMISNFVFSLAASFLFLLCIAFIVSGLNNPFIYSNF